MSEGLGKCSVNGCHGHSTTYWPLIGNGVGLCSSHHSNPPDGYYSNLVRASQEPPDDFDIPFDGEDFEYEEDYSVWTTKDGEKIPIEKLKDTHLLNIDKFIERKLIELGETSCMIDTEKCGSGIDDEIAELEHWQCVMIEEIKRRGLLDMDTDVKEDV